MATSPNEAVTKALRDVMHEHRVNASELGRRLGKSHMWAKRRLDGDVALTVVDVHEIAAALGVSPDVILTPPANSATP